MSAYQWVVRNSDGQFCLGVGPDPSLIATQPGEYSIVDTGSVGVEYPDPRTQKWNGSAVVAKTGPEIATFDAALTDAESVKKMATDRILSAIVWAVIDTYSAPATKTKFDAAKAKVVTAYRTQPWL